MNKLKEVKKFHDIFVDSINELDNNLKIQLKQIKIESQQNITQERILLLHAICDGENLDFNILKSKYLKPKELVQISEEIIVEPLIIDEALLSKIEIDNIKYYYEEKENGNVYNMSSKLVGIYKNNQILIN
jgi:hypothetical protein